MALDDSANIKDKTDIKRVISLKQAFKSLSSI
jgi:hypothetical protein